MRVAGEELDRALVDRRGCCADELSDVAADRTRLPHRSPRLVERARQRGQDAEGLEGRGLDRRTADRVGEDAFAPYDCLGDRQRAVPGGAAEQKENPALRAGLSGTARDLERSVETFRERSRVTARNVEIRLGEQCLAEADVVVGLEGGSRRGDLDTRGREVDAGFDAKLDVDQSEARAWAV